MYWFPDRSTDVAMATNFRREIANMPSFLGLTIHNRWQDGKVDGRVNRTEEVLST